MLYTCIRDLNIYSKNMKKKKKRRRRNYWLPILEIQTNITTNDVQLIYKRFNLLIVTCKSNYTNQLALNYLLMILTNIIYINMHLSIKMCVYFCAISIDIIKNNKFFYAGIKISSKKI